MARSCTRRDSAGEDTSQNRKTKKPAVEKSRTPNSEKTESSATRKSGLSTVHSLYALLGVARDASPREITAAYRRRALMCHPDKIRQRQQNQAELSTAEGGKMAAISVEEATKHFQQLQAAYGVLNDPKRRERYDRTGETDDDELEGKSYEEAYAFYREKFPEVTEDAIDQFKARYLGSEEEKEDIQDFVSKFKGDLTKFFGFIPLSDPSDAKRYKEVLSSLVEEKKIKETPAYKRTIREFENIAGMYKKRFEQEKNQAGKKRKFGKPEDDTSALALAILGNMSKREAASNRFLNDLEQKYSKKSKKA